MLKFGKKTTALLNNAYKGADLVQRRLVNRRVLDPHPGERVVDIGCGNGLLTAELARAIGEDGFVTGIDPSAEMRKSAELLCREFANVQISEGLADVLPFEDQSVDKAVSIQVFEYLDDIPAALAETFRVLKPGGRLVIGDMHFGTLAWHSEKPERMKRMRESWDHHFTEGAVPSLLPGRMRDPGFGSKAVYPLPSSIPVSGWMELPG